MLAALSFRAEEIWWQRGMAVFVFLAFVLSRYALGPALHVWSDPDLAILLDLNSFAVASLMALIAVRYAGIMTEPNHH